MGAVGTVNEGVDRPLRTNRKRPGALQALRGAEYCLEWLGTG